MKPVFLLSSILIIRIYRNDPLLSIISLIQSLERQKAVKMFDVKFEEKLRVVKLFR
ncbi:hypothetical cytosolic protein [Syntrophus aciditrophicus SB]|uniref:Hypothetical cytosolic protein n=1 Tax=Syntrophus aciditrophicus (strain SB) TaxID=56780 RepID=Q2LW00_SYNAS|nr:hypothetical cytosolic protein [Syntrophus aciditrophicus SB]